MHVHTALTDGDSALSAQLRSIMAASSTQSTSPADEIGESEGVVAAAGAQAAEGSVCGCCL